jgi:dTDP-4-dehydrorhamnose 3,5-epimerase
VEARATPLLGLQLLMPRVFADPRGCFLETWRAERYEAFGIRGPFVQDGLSRSIRGTVRGLHYQVGAPQGKLVWVTRGAAFDVAVDLRDSSPTFGEWYGTTLSEEERNQLWIPPGFAHGFMALSEVVDVAYKFTVAYTPDDQRVVRWSDPAIGIAWPTPRGVTPLLSPKDAAAPLLADAERLP